MPLPEEQWQASLKSISSDTSATIDSIISIVVWGSGAILYYDHWEDGYEDKLNAPTQASTEVWGDGNEANGKPPDYAFDPYGLSKGAVILLRNCVDVPRDGSIVYDGGDRFASSRPLSVSRAGWATIPGSVLCCMVYVNAIHDYGVHFACPIGEDVTLNGLFNYTGLLVMAKEDGTSVAIDKDGPGAESAEVISLNQGESWLVNGGIRKGASIDSSQPVQAHLITGDKTVNYESRAFTLFPDQQWASTYLTPVGTSSSGQECHSFLYNPNGIPITVNITTSVGTASLQVPAYGTSDYLMPQGSGARFQSAQGEVFQALTAVNASSGFAGTWEWGFSMLPDTVLTTETIVGWAPGSSDLTENGSSVYICPIQATRIYADYNGDGAGALVDPRGGRCDAAYDVDAFASLTIRDPDKDQTAMRVYTLDNTLFAAAWGEDSEFAGSSDPFMDVGGPLLPGPILSIAKESEVTADRGAPGLSVGDIVEYRIRVDNNGVRNLEMVEVTDTFHPGLAYQANSMRINGIPVADNGTGTTPFPLDETGYTIPSCSRNTSMLFVYEAEIIAGGTITNTARLPQYGFVSENTLDVPGAEGEVPVEGEGEPVTHGLKLETCSASPNPVYAGQQISLADLSGSCRSANAGELVRVTVGFRDPSGAWAGNDPAVVYSGTPGTSWQKWSNSVIFKAPSVAGTYAVWIRHSPGMGSAAAIQDFKDAVPTVADEIRDDTWDKPITVVDAPGEGEPDEGETQSYGLTVHSCTITPNPVDPGMPVTLSGLSGQCFAATDSQTMKITAGFRDGSGAWKGGEPVVAWTGKPGVSPLAWSGSATVLAPSQPGTYYVWVHNTPTTSDSAALTDFKSTVSATPDEARNDRFETPLTVSPLQGIQLTQCAFSPNPASPGQKVTLSSVGGQYRGPSGSATVKITAGFRDASGAWAGSDPVVVKTGIPGTTWKAWAGSAALIAPLTAGTYQIWVRSTATTSDRDALADFKAVSPTSGDRQFNDTWATALIIGGGVEGEPGEGESGEGELAEGEETPAEGEGEAETPAGCGCGCNGSKHLPVPLNSLQWLGDLLVLGIAVMVLGVYHRPR